MLCSVPPSCRGALTHKETHNVINEREPLTDRLRNAWKIYPEPDLNEKGKAEKGGPNGSTQRKGEKKSEMTKLYRGVYQV